MKTVVLIAATGLAGLMVFKYWKQTKKGKCACTEEVPGSIKAPETDKEEGAVRTFDADARSIFNTPERLLVNTKWPISANVAGLTKL